MTYPELLSNIRTACLGAGVDLFLFGNDANTLDGISNIDPSSVIALLNLPTGSGSISQMLTESWSFSLFIGKQDILTNAFDNVAKPIGTISREELIGECDTIANQFLINLRAAIIQNINFRKAIAPLYINQNTGVIITFDLITYKSNCSHDV